MTAAVLWCLLFAGVHLYWALGGGLGLAGSAGSDLANRRPTVFVLLGLYGVAALLLGGAVVVRRLGTHRSRSLIAVVALVGLGLSVRAILVEVLLVLDVGGVRRAVGPVETHWSLVLWNPWFLLGGLAFLAAAIHRPASTSSAIR